jgi:uncharacterized protein (DUF4415 family)
VRYDWDDVKDWSNQRKHGVWFELATLVFDDERCILRLDRADESGEHTMAKNSSVLSRPGRLVTMTSEDIRNRQWTEEEKAAVRRLAAKQRAGDESDIDYSDIPKLTPEQLSQFVRFRDRPRKVPVSVRLDAKVVEWLKSKGEGHLTRINDILLNLMEAEMAAKK